LRLGELSEPLLQFAGAFREWPCGQNLTASGVEQAERLFVFGIARVRRMKLSARRFAVVAGEEMDAVRERAKRLIVKRRRARSAVADVHEGQAIAAGGLVACLPELIRLYRVVGAIWQTRGG
jgi:hypothetical protein